jgi:hypothetical protein
MRCSAASAPPRLPSASLIWERTDSFRPAPADRAPAASRPSSPFTGKVSLPESGHSFRLPVCCVTKIDGQPWIRLRTAGYLRNRYGLVLLHWHGGGRHQEKKFDDISCRTSNIPVLVPHSVGPPIARHNLRVLILRARQRCSSRYSRYGVSTSSIHFINTRTRRDRLLRCATTSDTASARRRKSGMISTSAPLSKYRPIPKSGA